METSIFSYIKGRESEYETEEVRVGDNWNWNMRNHVQLIFHLMHSQFYTGENDFMRRFQEVMGPIVELANWTEDIELKDIVLYTEGKNARVRSFLLKKYHEEVYSRKHNLEEFIDDITESDNTYGLWLGQMGNDPKPETIHLTSIAFADQTNVEGGTIGFKHFFSPDSIRAMEKHGWGLPENGATITCDELAVLADSFTAPAGLDEKKNKSPGKLIETYIVRGNLPEHFLEDNDNQDDWYNQLQIVAFYTKQDGKKEGVILYRQKEKDSKIRAFTSSPVQNRACGYSVGEKMLHPQIWTNFLSIHEMELLEAAATSPVITDDEAFANRNDVRNVENLEVLHVDSETKIVPQILNTNAGANIQSLQIAVDRVFNNAQFSGAAQDPILGKEAVSGTTFRGQERTVAQGRGPHDRKRGKRAKFIEEIYRKDIIPQMVKEITKGEEFLADLSAEELSWVREQLATNYANKKIKEKLMDFSKPVPEEAEKEELVKYFKDEFGKSGNKKLLQILKDEFKGIEIKIGINVANKQKDLANLSDKLLSIFQFVFSNPQGFQQAMQNPALAKSFQDILEYSGLHQTDFMSLVQAPAQPAPVQPQGQAPELALNQQQNGQPQQN